MGRTVRFIICYIFSFLFLQNGVVSLQILSKSRLEKCEKSTESNDQMNCTTKIVVNLSVPSESDGREASMVAEIVEMEQNSTNKMQTLRTPPVITINKSATYAQYELTYIRDVPFKPQEFYVQTRKCDPTAGANVVHTCERLRDEQGHIIEKTQPICCPCGPKRRVPSSCGNIIDKLIKGKANTAHCLRFPSDWFHVFGIGKRSIGFSVQIEMKIGSQVSEVIVGPENRAATSTDNFLRVNLIGDFVGYTSIPTFEDLYLVLPRLGGPGQPKDLGNSYSNWMLLERERFTLDGVECNKIGVSYEAFNEQPNFCSSPLGSCLHNQLWNFWEADQNRISRNLLPLHCVERRFQRINEHPNAGPLSFSIGVTEVLNTNLVIELRADDIDYVFQRSPGKIINVTIPTFEALTQFGVATVTAENTGEVEASYSLTFDCSKGVALMEEQFFIMKPKEISVRSFKLYPTTDQAAKYICSTILKDSEYNEVDRADCQFTTIATVLDNGSQIVPFQTPKTDIHGFFGSIKNIWENLKKSFLDFITGETCRRKCSGFFDFSCHTQYICLSWVVLFGLFLAIFPTVLVLLWLLHQKGLFDPLYDWWEDHFGFDDQTVHRHNIHIGHSHTHVRKPYKASHHKHGSRYKRSSIHNEHKHNCEKDSDYYYYLHHVHKDKDKHKHRSSTITPQVCLDRMKVGDVRHHKHRRAMYTKERPLKIR